MKSFACLTSAFVIFTSCLAIGDEKAPSEKHGWQRLFREQAAAYRIDVGDSGEARLISNAVLQWTHPARGGEHGAIFLWLKDGLPVTIGTFNIWPLNDGRQRVAHELHSLSQTPLTAVWRGRKWTPPAKAIEWARLDAASSPPANREQRLRQMRQLAEGFSGRSHDRDDHRWVLRLLPRPLYRYELEADGARHRGAVADGAIFGFVEGTDLEVVLLLEARHVAGGDQWWYAAARMSDLSLDLSHGDRMVWHVGPGEYNRSTAAYYCADVETRTSPDQD